MNSVRKELELAGAIESSVAVIDVRSCGMLANTRTNSVCKGLGPVHTIDKRAHRVKLQV